MNKPRPPQPAALTTPPSTPTRRPVQSHNNITSLDTSTTDSRPTSALNRLHVGGHSSDSPGVYFYGTRKARLRIEPTTSALEACDEDCLFWASIDEFVSRVAREQRERVLCATTSGRDNSPEAANTRAGSSAPSMELEGQHGTLATRGQHDSVCEVFPATALKRTSSPGEAKHVSVHFKVIVGQNHPF